MAGADKRAKLLSDLLAAKGEAAGDLGRPAAPERAPVIQIANRRAEDRLSEAPAAPSVLYNKGTATASTFRPSYWSFDRDQQAAPGAAPARAEPPAPIAPVRPVASVSPVAHAPTRKPLSVNFAIGFGCLALVVSTTLFVLSLGHRAEAPAGQSEPPTIAAAPTPTAPVVPLPPQSQAPSVAAPPVAASAPALPASDAPQTPVSAAPTAEPAAAPVPAIAAAPAPTSSLEADALLARGDDLLATGDVAAARLFYQRAAEQGSAPAATAVGQTYDPAVLELLRVRGVRGDAQMAAEWYRKAIAAGDRQAEIRLKRLLARTPG